MYLYSKNILILLMSNIIKHYDNLMPPGPPIFIIKKEQIVQVNSNTIQKTIIDNSIKIKKKACPESYQGYFKGGKTGAEKKKSKRINKKK